MNLTVAPDRLFVIAGPCVIESAEQCLAIGTHVKKVCDKLGLSYVFKASFDKANRSANASFRGPGLTDGLVVLDRVKRELGVPVLTDVHQPDQVPAAARVVDVLQVPAFLARQTDLLAACGRTGCWVNIKKGQFMSPQEMGNAADKVRAVSPDRTAAGERPRSRRRQRREDHAHRAGDVLRLQPARERLHRLAVMKSSARQSCST
jgi:2-dehydro-3-deoxyphosphooctonate aldolase (KDO 8-P synthase)